MKIISKIDDTQTDINDRKAMAFCPNCGQKLFATEAILHRGSFRAKCRRCKKYVRVEIFSGVEQR